MYYKQFLYCLLIILGITLGMAVLGCSAFAQSTQEQPTRSEFGFSLKQLKWDPEKRVAIETKSHDEKRADGDAEDVVRVNTELVVFEVDISNPVTKLYVRGLTQSDFVVTVDGQPQQIAHFSVGDDLNVPRSIVLIIDYSCSQLAYINSSIDGAKLLVEQLGPNDQMAIVTDDVALLTNFTTDKVTLKGALESLRKMATADHRVGRSEQFSALLASARELFLSEHYRRIIVFQTDGDELGFLQPPHPNILGSRQLRSRIKEYSLDDVYVALEKSRATVYPVFASPNLFSLSPSERRKQAKTMFKGACDGIDQVATYIGPHPPSSKRNYETSLSAFVDARKREQEAVLRLTGLTGGWAPALKPERAAEIYRFIWSDLNDRYVIGFYPTKMPRDGKRHEVLIKVQNHPNYFLWGRRSYYAPGPEE